MITLAHLPTMPTRFDVVAEALEWENTPFLWQASLKQVGCDCKGLVVGVARHLGLPQAYSSWARMSNYHKVRSPVLLEGMEELFVPSKEILPADVLVFEFGSEPQHLAIVTEAYDGRPTKMVHTYNSGPMRVREITVGSMIEKLHSAWAWPNLADERVY